MIKLISNLLNIKKGEGKPFFLFFVCSFFIGLVTVFFETAASALFLTQWGVSAMPYTYLAGSIIIAIFGYIYSKIEQKVSISNLFIGGFLFLFITIMGFRLCFYFTDSRIIAAFLFIWIDMIAVIGDMIFWGLINLSFDARQGKRLFGLIGTGDVIASILGGFSVPLILKLMSSGNEISGGSLNLLYLAGIMMFICCIIFVICISVNKSKLSEGEEDSDSVNKTESKKESGLIDLIKNKYIRYMFISSVLSIFIYYFVDYAYYEQIEKKYPTENEITSFIAAFCAVRSIINLLFRTFASGRLLNKYGLSFGLFALPVLLLLTAVGMIISKFVSPVLIMFFWFTMLSKLIDLIIRYAVLRPANLILYQPLHQNQRIRAQVAVESIVEPIAGGVAGLILILAGFIIKLQSIHIAFVLIIASILWIKICSVLKKEYPEMLKKALDKRAFGGINLSLDDPASKQILLNGLTSQHIGEIFYSLSTLDELGFAELNQHIISLLNHEENRVKLEALRYIEKRNITEAVNRLYLFIENEKDLNVKSKAIMVLCTIGENDVLEFVLPLLNLKETVVKKGVIAGLLRSGGIEGVLAAGGILTEFIKSFNPQDRIFAAETLGIIGIKSFYRPLLELMNDNVLSVRKAAVEAAGELKSPKLWKAIIDLLYDNELKITASNALMKGDEDTISLLIEQFNRNNTGYGVKKRIAQILSRMKKEESVKNFFISKLDYPEDSIRNIIYKFLNNVDFKSPPGKINEILNIIDGEIKSIVFNIAALEDIKNDSEYKVLTRAIEYDVFSKTEKIFFLLSFIYQRELITSAKTNFMSESREKKIYALEIIDNILSNDLKNKFFPVIDELSNDQRLKKMTVFYPVEQLPKIEKLKKIITGNKDTYSFWTRTCAVYIAGKFALKDFYQPVIDALNDDSSIVRETAVWAFGRLNPSDLIERLQMLLKDESAIVSDIAGYVIETVGLAQLKIKKQYLTKTGECETGLFVTIVENENESRARRCRAARQLANIESDESKKSLFKMLAVEDETILSEVLKSLVFSGFEINSEAKKQLLKLVNSEFEDIENTLRLIAVFKGKDEYNELYSALKIEILRNCERIISIISLLNGKNNYKDLYFWFIENRLINYNIPDKMLNLLKKYLEFVSDENVKNTIYCLLTTYSFSKLFEKLNVTSDLIKEPLKKSLELIAFGSEKWLRSWTRAVAIRIVGNLEFKEYVPKIVVLMKDPDFIIRETAVMVLHKLDKPVYENYKHDLKNDLNPNIRKIIRELE